MARIRTIKPEFWSHPILARQDDATKLMAISLLNFSDDEGYFHAEPNLVRGFCRPFDDDSTITKKCLENLSKIGYISISENEFYGPIGLIEKFSEHQRIDRPNDSKLKSYYSSKDRRKIVDKSKEERKGKGKERKGLEFSPDAVFLNEFSKTKFDEKYISGKSLKMFDDLLRLDKYSKEEIVNAISWARADEFWSKNFLSPLKLRSNDKNGVKYIDRFLVKAPKIYINPVQQEQFPFGTPRHLVQ